MVETGASTRAVAWGVLDRSGEEGGRPAVTLDDR